MLRLGIFINPDNPKTSEILRRFIPLAAERHIDLLAVDGHGRFLPEEERYIRRSPHDDLLKQVDLLLAFGGDGTILRAAAFVGASEVPILGVNLGRLGFLAEVTPDELQDRVDRLLSGEYTVEQRMMLEAVVASHPEPIRALNDLVLEKEMSARVVEVEVRVEGHRLAEFLANGLIFSTPTGSTGYALSAGGPILHSSIDAFLVVPVCAHSLSLRPLVIPSNQTLVVRLRSPEGGLLLEADGRIVDHLRTDEEITIRRCAYRTSLVHFGKRSFYDVLRDKLGWGIR
ncbi:MAG: NAD(+)/NADH kinase [Candidatus Latescibacteria bacterium]|nr:NAD(+)/NADH kinase [Candidatus Latescibacterota bacterium]